MRRNFIYRAAYARQRYWMRVYDAAPLGSPEELRAANAWTFWSRVAGCIAETIGSGPFW